MNAYQVKTPLNPFAQIEFLVSIKKGSQPATLGDVDIEYRASENINTSLLLWYGKYQPLGSIPRFFSSFLASSLNQFARLTLSFAASMSNCCRKSGCILIWNVGDCPPTFGVLSFTLDIVRTLPFNMCGMVRTLYHAFAINKTPPNSITSTNRGLTTNDNTSIEVAMRDHNTPVTGRNSHTQNIVFIWRFAECQQNKTTYHLVIAHTENEARSMLPNIFLVFTARIRVGVGHA